MGGEKIFYDKCRECGLICYICIGFKSKGMVIVVKVGTNKLEPYGQITDLKQDHPEFSISYLQNAHLSIEPILYKGYFIYRINKTDVKK